jgi:hypothetical protein
MYNSRLLLRRKQRGRERERERASENERKRKSKSRQKGNEREEVRDEGSKFEKGIESGAKRWGGDVTL